jgi:hypothetical protein
MTPRHVVLDTLHLLCPLGMRFRDTVTGATVSDGLRVEAWPSTGYERRTAAVQNRSGVFAFHGLPGMRAVENGAGDDAFWASPPDIREFVVEALDAARRFLPVRFLAAAPTRGLFQPACAAPDSPPGDAAWVPLFSAPWRPPPPGMAVLRAELFDAVYGVPAAWALVEAETGAPPLRYRGMADDRGRVALFFPYPEPEGFHIGSPVPSNGAAVGDYEWPVRVSVFYRPYLRPPEIPDLCDVLDQPPAGVSAAAADTAPFHEARLRFGRELLLQTLYVTAAVSPLEGD